MYKIVFINIFIGPLPWYFPYFIHTCKYNNDIDFLIYTDNDAHELTLPRNVKMVDYTLLKFNKVISKKLNQHIQVTENYKLCDFKPTYGLIFSDDIKDYDFWGYCDLDIIWGNIRHFLDDTLLDKYDVISARHDYLTGCFALYKNSDKCKRLFYHSKDYLRVFLSNEHHCFDETNFAFDKFEQGLHYSLINTEIESMTHVVQKLHESGYINAYFEFQIIEGLIGDIVWDTGNITFRKEFEALLYHLVRFKRVYHEPLDLKKRLGSTIKINHNTIS